MTSLARAALRVLPRLLLPIAILAACGWLVRRQLHALDPDALRHAVAAVPSSRLVLAAVATAGSYASLAVVERGLLGTAGIALRWPRVLLASFIANAVSASVGLVLVSAAFLRLRLYGRWTVPARDAVHVSLAFAPIVILSALLGAGLALLAGLPGVQRALDIGSAPRAALALLLATPAATFLAIGGGRELRWRSLRLVVPPRGHRLALLGAGLCDWACAGTACFAVTGIAVSAWPLFQLQFIFGWLFGAASGLPAGAGVIDATMLRTFGTDANLASLAAGLILFRLIYFALPTLLALALLAITELRSG